MPRVHKDFKRSMFEMEDRQRDIINSKVNLAKAHYDKKSSRIQNLVNSMTEEDNDEDGRFGDRISKRRKVRKLLNFDWNMKAPNLMLNLPTKVSQTKEMAESAQQQLLEQEMATDMETATENYAETNEYGDEDDQSVVEVDNREFPPHILADLQKDVIYNA